MRSRKWIVGTGLLALVSASLCSSPAQAAFPGANGKIAFETGATSGSEEIFAIDPVTGVRTNLTNHPAGDRSPAWSADGSAVAFSSGRESGARHQIYKMNADGSGQTRVSRTNLWSYDEPSWSPDGTRIAAHAVRDPGASRADIVVMDADGANESVFPLDNSGSSSTPAWSPDGSRIAFTSTRSGGGDIYVMPADGSSPVQITNSALPEGGPNWSPDGQKFLFGSTDCTTVGQFCKYLIKVINVDGTGEVTLKTSTDGFSIGGAVWSPDGSKIAYQQQLSGGSFAIRVMNADGSGDVQVSATHDVSPDWQPVVTGYPRPKGATPLRASLVRAFTPCAAPSHTHGPPLAFPSCGQAPQSPPALHPAISPNVNVGTADHNSAPADFVGSVRMDVIAGNPATPADEADVGVTVRATDLRCFHLSSVPACGPQNAADGDDYTGELQGVLNVRITDKDNTPHPGGPGAGTVQDAAIEFTIPCAATSATFTGGLCTLTSSMEALVPGSVAEGRRSIWQLGQIQVFDGGPDADADTANNSLFATQGIFIP